MASKPSQSPKSPSANVTEARATAQRAKVEVQTERRRNTTEKAVSTKSTKGKTKQESVLAKRRAHMTVERAIADYLLDHEGGNASLKTVQWHQTALGLLRRFLEEEREITLVGDIDAPDLNAWFAYMRKTPASRGKVRSVSTVN